MNLKHPTEFEEYLYIEHYLPFYFKQTLVITILILKKYIYSILLYVAREFVT